MLQYFWNSISQDWNEYYSRGNMYYKHISANMLPQREKVQPSLIYLLLSWLKQKKSKYFYTYLYLLIGWKNYNYVIKLNCVIKKYKLGTIIITKKWPKSNQQFLRTSFIFDTCQRSIYPHFINIDFIIKAFLINKIMKKTLRAR